jgi:putative ABC transport system substrate-binding protein
MYQHQDFRLISYGNDLRVVFRRAAFFVDRMAKGETRGELPIEGATKTEMVVNLKMPRRSASPSHHPS